MVSCLPHFRCPLPMQSLEEFENFHRIIAVSTSNKSKQKVRKHIFHHSYITMTYGLIKDNIVEYIAIPLYDLPLLLITFLVMFCIHLVKGLA